jgi:hypothetical protein
MLLILGFAESSNDSESIFRSRDGKAPGRKRSRLWDGAGVATEGSASEAADAGA